MSKFKKAKLHDIDPKYAVEIQVHHRKVPDQIFSKKFFLNCT